MLGFIISVVAGYIVPHIEGAAGRPVAKFLANHITVEENETRLITFVVAMLGAGVLASLLHSGSPFWMILGGALGYFGQRLVEAAKTAMDNRKADED